nr:pyruvate formate lyase family protein [Collinsella sp. zg1085]
MLSKRCSTIKESLFAHKRTVSLERARIYKASYQRSEGEAPVIRRARALAALLAEHELVIDDYDLLVGNRSVQPRAGVISPEMSPYWILDELDEFETRPQDQFVMSEEDKRIYREELYPYFAGQSLNDWYQTHSAPEVQEAQKTKVFSVAQTDKGQGHIIADFETLLTHGFEALLEKAKTQAAQNPDNDFYRAAVISLEASIAYIQRYHALVVKRATTCTDPAREAELSCLAEVLEHISTKPARNFYDALQLVWLAEVILQHESNASSLSLGRMDQYLWPYYQTSKAEDMSDTQIRELLTCFYLKCNTIVAIRSTESASFFAGFPIGFNLVVGGIDAEGNDASNELSYLLLDIQKDTRLPQPNLSLRAHAKTLMSSIPRQLKLSAWEMACHKSLTTK